MKLEFSCPGKPTDNPYIESFNGRLRAECLNQHWFETLAEAREEIESWGVDYNERRPHTALGWGRRMSSRWLGNKPERAEEGRFSRSGCSSFRGDLIYERTLMSAA